MSSESAPRSPTFGLVRQTPRLTVGDGWSDRTTHANLTALLDMMNPPVMPLMEPGKDILLGILVRAAPSPILTSCET